MIILILMLLCLLFVYKWFHYYCLSRGLLFKLIKDYGFKGDSNELKMVYSAAIEQTIREFFKII
ncbi:MAG: hypothetical protein RR738_07515 [Anaerorhabdus sp.]|uniref:hypothetical protein n=1 Tax=Anaerorhabdus sp. TaxID=1872524 RepID=UPI002FC784C9